MNQVNEVTIVDPATNRDVVVVLGENDSEQGQGDDSPTEKATFTDKLVSFLHTYDFPILVLIAIGLAKAYPPLGAEYLAPKYTAKWLAVCIIFFFSGLGLPTKDFFKIILRHLPFNIFEQAYNFLVVSAAVFGVSQVLAATGLLQEALIDGLIMCACLPMSINVGIVLTAAAGGDEAAAVLHSAGGNVMGIFISPLLILMYLPGVVANVDLADLIVSLVLRVLVPLVIGQLVQKMFKGVHAFYLTHKAQFRKIPELLLVFIIYTIFCKTFQNDGENAGGVSIVVLLISELALQAALSAIAWVCLRFLIPNEPRLRVMGTICSANKTIALGAPLIGSIVADLPNEGFYFLPLLMWHPMQLVFGSLLTSGYARWITSEVKRLNPDVSEHTTMNRDVETNIADDSSEERA